MKKRTLLVVVGLLMLNFCFAQNKGKYEELKKEALHFYKSKEYQKSADKYREAFDFMDGKATPTDRYNAACSYSLANRTDTAFYHLFRLAKDAKYHNYGHITADPDLNLLHDDQRWKQLIAMVKANKEEAERYLDKPLVALLDTIYREDQSFRRQVGEIAEKHGWDSEEVKAHWELINQKDSVNVIKVQKILDERGWLGADVVGNKGNLTLFLVIQHANIEIQEKYLPMMREAVQKGNARARNLALLEDRVALRKGEKQIYGSQVARDKESGEYYVLPLIDPDNVNKRRAEVGLGVIEDYISYWGMTWDVEAYKKQLPLLEAKQKK
ncbi:MAG: DUF6624 domain-containing protein [Marinifilaceae bacterium]